VCVSQVKIGNAEYQCSCIRYVPKDITDLIIGLSVAAGFLIFVTIIIIHIISLKRRQRGQLTIKEKDSKDDEDKDYHCESFPEDSSRKSKDFDNTEEHYSTRLPDDSKESHA